MARGKQLTIYLSGQGISNLELLKESYNDKTYAQIIEHALASLLNSSVTYDNDVKENITNILKDTRTEILREIYKNSI